MMPSKTLTNPQFMARLGQIKKAAGPEGPDWLLSRKAAAWNAAVAGGFPSQRDEEWKYTDLSSLLDLPVEPSAGPLGTADRDGRNGLFNPQDITIVLADGYLPAELPSIPAGINGLTLKKFSAVSEKEFEDRLTPAFDQPPEIFADLNTALMPDGLWIHVPRQVQVKPVIHICHLSRGKTASKLFCPRVIVTTEPLAEAHILMTFISLGGGTASFTNALTDISVSSQAKISLTTIQDENHSNFHVHSTRVSQQKDSGFENFSLTTGGRLTRNNLTVTLLEEGASTHLKGLYLLQGAQHADNHTVVNHIAPHGTSNQLYKGILNGQSQAVFNGKIYVHPEAQQTNAYQLNKNLLMGEHCRVNTKPQLEIFADDVKCSHGATVGQLDEDEIFYLQTRAIPKKTAVSLLAKGFVEDLILQAPQDTVQERLYLTVNPIMEAVTR
ncbi:MAG: Fe-S cluster assembly protein SufD [Candidatus Omnitrophota bacterium]|jgi:Fe-S cluster assembly protein SufD